MHTSQIIVDCIIGFKTLCALLKTSQLIKKLPLPTHLNKIFKHNQTIKSVIQSK